MKRPVRLLAVAASVALVVSAMSAVSTDAQAQAPACNSGLDHRQPVLLVHGFNSSAGAWDKTKASFANSMTCVSTFDYGSNPTDWVTSPAISRRLGSRIHQLALSSKAGEGTGKVIVVGHSMGGLATRCAVAPSCGGGSTNDLRELITLGTPNDGTYLKSHTLSLVSDVIGPALAGATCGNTKLELLAPGICKFFFAVGISDAGHAFTPGSGELTALPELPSNIPDFAIAGSFPLNTYLFTKKIEVGNLGDLIVARDSALSRAKSYGGVGGTGQNVDCGSGLLPPPLSPEPFIVTSFHCWHGTETHYSGFIDQAQSEIAQTERVDTAVGAHVLHSLPGGCGSVTTQTGRSAVVSVLPGDSCSTDSSVVRDFYNQIRGHAYPNIPSSCGGAQHCGYLPGNRVPSGPAGQWDCYFTYPVSTHYADCAVSSAESDVDPWDNPAAHPITVDIPLQPPAGPIPSCDAALLGAALRKTSNLSGEGSLYLFGHSCYDGYAAGLFGTGKSDNAAFVAIAKNGKWVATVAGSAVPNDVLKQLPVPLAASRGLLYAKKTPEKVRF